SGDAVADDANSSATEAAPPSVTPAALRERAREVFDLATAGAERSFLRRGERLIAERPFGPALTLALTAQAPSSAAGPSGGFALLLLRVGPAGRHVAITSLRIPGRSLPLLAELVAEALSIEMSRQQEQARP